MIEPTDLLVEEEFWSPKIVKILNCTYFAENVEYFCGKTCYELRQEKRVNLIVKVCNKIYFFTSLFNKMMDFLIEIDKIWVKIYFTTDLLVEIFCR